jgi:hypothetical protein
VNEAKTFCPRPIFLLSPSIITTHKVRGAKTRKRYSKGLIGVRYFILANNGEHDINCSQQFGLELLAPQGPLQLATGLFTLVSQFSHSNTAPEALISPNTSPTDNLRKEAPSHLRVLLAVFLLSFSLSGLSLFLHLFRGRSAYQSA